MAALNVTRDNFQNEVMESSRPVLLDFWASWCGPCRMLSPVIDQIAAENPDIKVCKVNVDEQQELASQFRVMGIPTLLVMKDGEVMQKSVGAQPKGKILAMFDSLKA